jgi:hypothetical protein
MVGENYLGLGWARPWHARIASKLREPQWRALEAIASPHGLISSVVIRMTTMTSLLRLELIEERDNVPTLTELGRLVLEEVRHPSLRSPATSPL